MVVAVAVSTSRSVSLLMAVEEEEETREAEEAEKAGRAGRAGRLRREVGILCPEEVEGPMLWCLRADLCFGETGEV